jgi:hypothetical protein
LIFICILFIVDSVGKRKMSKRFEEAAKRAHTTGAFSLPNASLPAMPDVLFSLGVLFQRQQTLWFCMFADKRPIQVKSEPQV